MSSPSPLAELDASLLVTTKTTSFKDVPASNTLVFGQTFTDHMIAVKWTAAHGWHAPELKAYGPLSLDPACTVLHYSPTLFEGMKAYKDKNGNARLFRADKNMERMNRGCARLGFPSFDGAQLTELIKKMVSLDEHWIPTEPGCSLYIRPTIIGTRASLGVGPSNELLLFVIASPVGPYYPGGWKPVSLLSSTKDVRAWPGGTGAHKFGANYAPAIEPAVEAAKLGYQQVLWLFGPDSQITEAGMMNYFAVLSLPDGSAELVSPPLSGMILPGVTRDSILALARAHADPANPLRIAGLPERLVVSEREICMPEVRDAAKAGTLLESFCSGTAAVVCALGKIGFEGEDVIIPVGETGLGPFATAIHRIVTDIQLGETEHAGWSTLCN